MKCSKHIKHQYFFKIDGNKITLARAEKAWTIARLAEISGVTRKTIGEIEKGKKSKVRYSTLEQIAVALEKSVESFFIQNEVSLTNYGGD